MVREYIITLLNNGYTIYGSSCAKLVFNVINRFDINRFVANSLEIFFMVAPW